MDWGAALRAARPAAGVEGSEAARWAREAGGRRTRARGGGGRRTWARGGGGRRRAASRARATVGGVEGEGDSGGVDSEKTRRGSGPCIYSPPL